MENLEYIDGADMAD